MRTRLALCFALLAPMSGAATLGAPASGAAASCAPAGAELSVSARDKKFDKDCLAAPAGQAFTIAFDNQDVAMRHNVAIYDTAQGDKVLFKGEVIYGPGSTTYSVPAQAAGTYEFRCDPHDETMIGTFIVG
jgi:plastocyanin